MGRPDYFTSRQSYASQLINVFRFILNVRRTGLHKTSPPTKSDDATSPDLKAHRIPKRIISSSRTPLAGLRSRLLPIHLQRHLHSPRAVDLSAPQTEVRVLQRGSAAEGPKRTRLNKLNASQRN